MHTSSIASVVMSVWLLASCASSTLAGRYVDPTKPTTYLEIHSDGTTFGQDEEGSVSGVVRQEGNEVVVTMSNGHAAKFHVKGDSLVGDRITLTRQ